MLDWRRKQDYEFTRQLSPQLWAWEFLRRNPDYAKDWCWFDKTFRALEAAYGSPPNRDYHRWKQDPRAYRAECEIDSENSAPEGNQLLIECWMGSKWGFFKFPIDPKTDHPKIGTELEWRTASATVRLYYQENANELLQTLNAERVACVIDLKMSIKEQTEDLRRQLAILKRKRATPDIRLSLWILCIRYLDAQRENASDKEILSVLLGDYDAPQEMLSQIKQLSHYLVQGGYRELLFQSTH